MSVLIHQGILYLIVYVLLLLYAHNIYHVTNTWYTWYLHSINVLKCTIHMSTIFVIFLSETLSYYAVLTTPGDFRLLGQSKILPAGLLFNFERIFPKIARNIFALPFCLQVDSIVVVGIAIQNINYTYSLYTGTYCDVLLLVSPYQTSNHTYSFHRYI